MSNSLRPHGTQRARLPCPSPTPRAYSNSCPLGRWCHPYYIKHLYTWKQVGNNIKGNGRVGLELTCNSLVIKECHWITSLWKSRRQSNLLNQFGVFCSLKFWVSINHIIIVPWTWKVTMIRHQWSFTRKHLLHGSDVVISLISLFPTKIRIKSRQLSGDIKRGGGETYCSIWTRIGIQWKARNRKPWNEGKIDGRSWYESSTYTNNWRGMRGRMSEWMPKG